MKRRPGERQNQGVFGVAATDPVTLISVPVILGGVALLASYLPGSRASRANAAMALRAD